MSKYGDIRMQTGPTVKQYGRFHLKVFEVYRGERLIPTNEYQIMLDLGDGNFENLGLIKADESTLPELLSYLRDSQHHEYNQIYRTKHYRDQAVNDEARGRDQQYLDFLERRYARVDQAIRELEPDYQPDTTIYAVPQDPSDENKGECRFG